MSLTHTGRYRPESERVMCDRPKSETRKRNRMINLRMTDAEVAELDALCAQYRKSRGELIRAAITAAALMEAPRG